MRGNQITLIINAGSCSEDHAISLSYGIYVLVEKLMPKSARLRTNGISVCMGFLTQNKHLEEGRKIPRMDCL